MHMTSDLIADWVSLAMSLAKAITSLGALWMKLTGPRSDRCEDKVESG